VRDHLGLRTESTSNNTADFELTKAVTTLPREAVAAVNRQLSHRPPRHL
jgi:hypothetical protein